MRLETGQLKGSLLGSNGIPTNIGWPISYSIFPFSYKISLFCTFSYCVWITRNREIVMSFFSARCKSLVFKEKHLRGCHLATLCQNRLPRFFGGWGWGRLCIMTRFPFCVRPKKYCNNIGNNLMLKYYFLLFESQAKLTRQSNVTHTIWIPTKA